MMDQGNGLIGPELGDLDFQYDDADTFQVEVSELYSYSEATEIQSGPLELQHFLLTKDEWSSVGNRVSVIRRLLEAAESAHKDTRSKSVRALLYIVQGTWAEVDSSDAEETDLSSKVLSNVQENCLLLYRQGSWPILLQLLRLEAERPPPPNSASICISDSRALREVSTILCTIAEVFRHIGPTSPPEEITLKETFCEELSLPIDSDSESDLLAVNLLQMITSFCNGTSPHFPVKKLLLLLWKSLLLSLGGIEELKSLKAEARMIEGLPPAPPDTTDVVKTMRPASPPASLVDMIEVQQQRKSSRGQFKRQSLVKQSSMDEQEAAAAAAAAAANGDNIDPTELPDGMMGDEPNGETPAVGETLIAHSEPMDREDEGKEKREAARSLPWSPKAALRDLDNFLAQARLKFVGFQLPNDTTTLAGLPDPIHQGLRVLEKHKYTPLSEVQIMKEMQIERHPFTHKVALPDTPTERLYQALLPQMPQHMISLLKILLAAAPTSKAKTESVNILADVLPTPEASVENCVTPVQTARLSSDINRHKEILVKSISAILLLLLKHVKISHCLESEYIAQQLMFANCIPLVLKFFNQNVVSYAAARNTLPVFEFPKSVLERPQEITAEMLEGCTEVAGQPYCWRNVFACINLLRILNKLTKNKHSRVMMLVVFKSAPILKRALKVRQAMLQLYALKLLKMQTKYLGRQWRKTNMKTMSAIYQKVRHRLGDDWAFGSDLDARPWDFQAEEFSLQAAINDFHRRRYDRLPGASSSNNNNPPETDPLLDLDPVDNCFLSVLGRHFELLPDFKENYRFWLKCQVYDTNIEWEKLLSAPNLGMCE